MTAKMMLFKDAMDRQNAATRALLQLRSALVRDLRKTIPQEEKDTVCVVVSLKELCAVRSLDPDDYRTRTQVNVICEALMKCRTADELLGYVKKLAQEGRIWNGQRYLSMNAPIQDVLRQYADAAETKGQRLALA